ncbi:hypothetical protein [Lichenicola sp.]|uniref:hypothetical protein n=1 Tax=Lichenicola sp. TaxID=2804529 RepID=UPI003B008670
MTPLLAPVFRRCALALLLSLAPFAALGQDASSPDTASPTNPAPGGLKLSLPVQGGYDFHAVGPPSEAQRLHDAPLPDPSTRPKLDNSLHDPATGADTSAFGTAYTYPNPLNGTDGNSSVANAASKSANVPQVGGLSFVVFEWGYPPKPMPKVPGEDLTAAPPPVVQVRFAVQADDEAALDAKSLWIVQRAVQAYGRAGLTEITIERPQDRPGCCTRYPDLIKAELVREGLSPTPGGWLPGHRIRLVLAAMPASR